MAYTPINWATGDTITAAKLNRCDNGWGYESTQLFSETVTTEDNGSGIYEGQLAYSQLITADTITVTYDGNEYTCPSIGAGEYGAPYNDGNPDFSEFPFNLYANGETYITTQTAGTHTVTASAGGVEVSADFNSAVNACVDASALPMRCVHEVTTYDEMLSAKEAGRLLYFYSGSSMHIIVYFSEAESETAVQALPAGVENVETYGFVDIDGTLVFHVSIY